MKTVLSASLILILICSSLQAQEGESENVNKKLAYLNFGLSVANGSFNSYKIGNANQFYQFLLQDNSLELDDGALGFKQFGFGALNIKSKTVFGVELNLQLFHASHAIAGQNMSLNSGLNASMHFGLKTIDMAARFGPKLSDDGANISAEIGMLYGFMSGTILQSSDEWKQKGAIGPGMRGGIALDVPIKNVLIVFARLGYRYMLIEENHVDPATGKSGYTFYANGNDGDLLQVDWSGAYASIGLGIALKKKKSD